MIKNTKWLGFLAAGLLLWLPGLARAEGVYQIAEAGGKAAEHRSESAEEHSNAQWQDDAEKGKKGKKGEEAKGKKKKGEKAKGKDDDDEKKAKGKDDDDDEKKAKGKDGSDKQPNEKAKGFWERAFESNDAKE